MLIRAVLGFSIVETLALAGMLLWWADRVAGARLLAAFLSGIALWMAGNELPNWLGPDSGDIAMAMIGFSPLTSAFFFHFCVVFCGVRLPRWGVAAAYLLGGSATLAVQLLTPGELVWREHVGLIAIANTVGMVASMAWVLLGLGGIAVLLTALARARRPAFNQIAAVTASCLWGVGCLSGYGIVVLDLPFYPFPLLGLPLYPVILVYGILRYGVFVSNAWARRALAWALLLALGAVVVALTPLLPIESRWIGGFVVAISCIALNGPVRQFAERLVYPGGVVSASDLQSWRQALQSADSMAALETEASTLLSRRTGTEVRVLLGDGSAQPLAAVPCLLGAPSSQGWTIALHGWEAAPPGPRRVAELFGTVVADAAERVAQGEQIAARERERQLQARLAELGSLAATVAHDIRNPLNIIAMAVATASPEVRREVAGQVGRIAHLSSDLLDYAKPWKLVPQRYDLAAQVRAAASKLPHCTLGAALQAPLMIDGDPRRVEQALTNLLENARAASGAEAGADTPVAVHIDAEQRADAVLLHVCDDGQGVPEEIRHRLFEPFASRSPGGTGLGLAIVARTMAAHGGSVALTQRPPFATCFTLSFPLNHANPS